MPYRIKMYPMVEENDQVEENEQIEWVAEIPDLPGCVGCGDTPEEALAMVEDAKQSWIESALADGIAIPEPKNPDNSQYSGKFTLRVPKSLHKELSLKAEDEGLSLNQYIVYLITKNHHETSASSSDNQLVYTEETKRTFKAPFVNQKWPSREHREPLFLRWDESDRSKIY
ncbi:MAG TPA: toxin-antitoxin system HicB family antitoxin [Thermoanaerobacterales bacterium]|nr:toxin-antitoxin system HicB family antitoxin [Thermoanaerobacterales bacterium]